VLIIILVILDKFNEELFGMIGRCRKAEKRTTSRAGSVFVSKAASANGINQVKVIADFLNANH
jgi:hypothetical protein